MNPSLLHPTAGHNIPAGLQLKELTIQQAEFIIPAFLVLVLVDILPVTINYEGMYICAAFLKLPSFTPVHLAKVWLSIDDLVPGVWERIVENRNQMRVRIFKGGHLRGGILPLNLIHWKQRFSVFLCFGHIVLHYCFFPGPRTPLFHKVNSYTPLLD